MFEPKHKMFDKMFDRFAISLNITRQTIFICDNHKMFTSFKDLANYACRKMFCDVANPPKFVCKETLNFKKMFDQ